MMSLFNNHRPASGLESPLYPSICVTPDDPNDCRRNGSWACRMLKAQRRREALQQRNGADGRGRYEEAIAEFDLALFSDGSMAAAFHNRALDEQRTGSLSSAIKDYTRSIELDPELALASQNRASAHLEPRGPSKRAGRPRAVTGAG